MLEIVLASQSPRRRELLEKAGFEIRVSPVKVSEIINENLNPEENASQIATAKVRACLDQHKHLNSKGFLILGADTMVVLGDQILGKPESDDQAREFLRRLSSNTHSVISGLALHDTSSTKVWSGAVTTQVRFHKLSEEEIENYILTGEPMDKAGAYGIQGEGGKFVAAYDGSWSNVVGLPMERLEQVLKENGWSVRRRSP